MFSITWFTASCGRDGSFGCQLAALGPANCRGSVWRKLTLARTKGATTTPVWRSIATQLTLLNHPRVAVFILMLRVTYMRPSELLALKKKDLVPPLVPLLPCWLVVIAASETGVSTSTRVLDGSVPHKSTLAFMGQQALVPAEVWKFGEADPEFPLPCSKIVQGGNRRFGTRHDHVAHTSQWSQHRVQGFKKLCKRCQKPEQCRARSAMSQDTTSAVAWLPTATLSRAHSETSWKHQRLMNA